MPVVVDMSSNFFSRPVDVSQYAVVYGGAQKNVGIAGLTIGIVRDDMLTVKDRKGTPHYSSLHIPMRRWRVRFPHHSLTSCTRRKQLEELPSQRVRLEEDGGERVVPQHSARLRHLHGRPLLRLAGASSSTAQLPRARTSFRGLIPLPLPLVQLKIGGLDEIGRRNERKSEKLYAFLDQSKLYCAPVTNEFRSRMNVDFRVRAVGSAGTPTSARERGCACAAHGPNRLNAMARVNGELGGDDQAWDTALEAQLVKEADARGLLNLKGYRTVGGMRASLYNALPEEAIDELVTFLSEFEDKHLP